MARLNEIELAKSARDKRQAFEMRVRQSLSLREIGDHFGITVDVVREWLKEVRAWAIPVEDNDELRQYEADKIDRDENLTLQMLEMVGVQAKRKLSESKDIVRELDLVLKLEATLIDLRKQRALLLGLNKPVLVEHKLKIRDTFDEELEMLVTQLTGGGKVMSLPTEIMDED